MIKKLFFFLMSTHLSTVHADSSTKKISAEDFQNFKQNSISKKQELLKAKVGELKNLRKSLDLKDPLKVLIIGAAGGAGHRSAANSMEKVLMSLAESDALFQVKYIEPIPFEVKTWNKAMAANDQKTLKKLVSMKPTAERLLNNHFGKKKLRQKMLKQMRSGENALAGNPDIIIQAEHVGTKAFRDVIRGFKAQHRLVPTDFQLDNFVWGVRHENDPLSFRIDMGIGALEDNDVLLKEKDLNTSLFTGYPVRWDILELAQKLQNEETKDVGEKEVTEIISSLAEVGPGISQFDSKKDKTLLIMLGGAGANKEAFMRFIKDTTSAAKQLMKDEGTLHVFIAQGRSKGSNPQAFAEELEEFYKLMTSVLGAEKVCSLHLLGDVNAKGVAALMHNGVTLTKSGGGTVAELMTMGGMALFDISMSEAIRWEKFAYTLFEKNKWGYVLNPDQEGDLQSKLILAFETRSSAQKSMLQSKNQFHLDWPYAVLEDQIAIHRAKLVAPR